MTLFQLNQDLMVELERRLERGSAVGQRTARP
jgi:hypothetical protein